IASLFRRLEGEDLALTGVQHSRPVTAREFCRSLSRSETAIEYFVEGDAVSAFVVTREGLQIYRGITSRRRTEQMLSGLRFQIQKFGYGSDYIRCHLETLRRAVDGELLGLYGELVAPLEKMITGRRLIIIPHGPLHYVPFHALSVGN